MYYFCSFILSSLSFLTCDSNFLNLVSSDNYCSNISISCFSDLIVSRSSLHMFVLCWNHLKMCICRINTIYLEMICILIGAMWVSLISSPSASILLICLDGFHSGFMTAGYKKLGCPAVHIYLAWVCLAFLFSQGWQPHSLHCLQKNNPG